MDSTRSGPRAKLNDGHVVMVSGLASTISVAIWLAKKPSLAQQASPRLTIRDEARRTQGKRDGWRKGARGEEARGP